jgi:metal-responsive CopG/Arc/MetJ family transcriptional regulator
MKSYKPILINIPLTLLERLDHAAANLNLSRSELLRRSLRRDLIFITDHELKNLNQAMHITMRQYSQLSSDNRVTNKDK